MSNPTKLTPDEMMDDNRVSIDSLYATAKEQEQEIAGMRRQLQILEKCSKAAQEFRDGQAAEIAALKAERDALRADLEVAEARTRLDETQIDRLKRERDTLQQQLAAQDKEFHGFQPREIVARGTGIISKILERLPMMMIVEDVEAALQAEVAKLHGRPEVEDGLAAGRTTTWREMTGSISSAEVALKAEMEDRLDLEEATEALKEIEKEGSVSIEEVKKKLTDTERLDKVDEMNRTVAMLIRVFNNAYSKALMPGNAVEYDGRLAGILAVREALINEEEK